jgi:hypothetical protein
MGMKCYTIYTETTDVVAILEICDLHFSGYTYYLANGRYKGRREDSMVIEVVSTSLDIQRVYSAAKEIKKTTRQASVLVTEHTIGHSYI